MKLFMFVFPSGRTLSVKLLKSNTSKKNIVVLYFPLVLSLRYFLRMFVTVLRNWCCHAADQEVSWQVTWHIRDTTWQLWHVTLIHQTRGNTKHQTGCIMLILTSSLSQSQDTSHRIDIITPPMHPSHHTTTPILYHECHRDVPCCLALAGYHFRDGRPWPLGGGISQQCIPRWLFNTAQNWPLIGKNSLSRLWYETQNNVMTPHPGHLWAPLMVRAQVNLPSGHLSCGVHLQCPVVGQHHHNIGGAAHLHEGGIITHERMMASDLLLFVSITWSRQHGRSGLHAVHCSVSEMWFFLFWMNHTARVLFSF